MMGFKLTRCLCLGLGLSLSAAAPQYELGLKMGPGFALPSAVKDQHSNLSLHLVFTGQYKLSEKSSLIGEFGYRYFRADDWEKPLPPIAYAPDGTTGVPTQANSIDTRQDPLDGLGLSVGYRQALGSTGWSWQVGGNLHWMRSTDQAIGDVRATSAYHEGFAYVRSTTSIKPGVFVGLHSFINNDVFVEFNFVTVGYSQITYVPLVYTGQPAHTETSSRNKLSLELSMGYRF
jgi:hypothetical protein